MDHLGCSGPYVNRSRAAGVGPVVASRIPMTKSRRAQALHSVAQMRKGVEAKKKEPNGSFLIRPRALLGRAR